MFWEILETLLPILENNKQSGTHAVHVNENRMKYKEISSRDEITVIQWALIYKTYVNEIANFESEKAY